MQVTFKRENRFFFCLFVDVINQCQVVDDTEDIC